MIGRSVIKVYTFEPWFSEVTETETDKAIGEHHKTCG